MYYPNNNVYISDDKRVLFDLNNINTYQIDEKSYNIFTRLYKDESLRYESEDYENMYNLLFKKANSYPPQIRSISINVSNSCNLKCKYCFASGGNYGRENSILSKENARKIATIIKKNFPNVYEIVFFGGEPLLNIEAIEIICSELSNEKIRYALISNMTILNQNILKVIKDYNIQITASVDGPAEVHDANRIYVSNDQGTYRDIVNNIRLVNKEEHLVGAIEATYTRQAQELYTREEIVDFLKRELGINMVMLVDVATDDDNLKLYRADSDNKNMKLKVQKSINKIMNESVIMTDMTAGALLAFFGKYSNNYYCNAGLASILIDDKGDIWPCQMYIGKDNYLMGNAFADDNVIESEMFMEVKSRLEKINKLNIKDCNKCIAKYWCSICLPQSNLIDKTKPDYSGDCKDKETATIEYLEYISDSINNNTFYNLYEKTKSYINAVECCKRD